VLTGVARGGLFPRYELLDGEDRAAELEVTAFRERMTIRAQDSEWRGRSSGWFRSSFALEDEHGKAVAHAEKPSLFRRRLEVRIEGRPYRLEAASAFRRTFVLKEGGRQVGSIAPEGVFSRRIRADLPATLALPVRAFLVGLVIVQWRRAARRHAG